MKKKPVFFQSLFLTTLLFLGPRSVAQEQPSTAESAISDLAARLARPLQEAHVTKIIFADLKGPQGEVHPVGLWLADRLSESCSRDFPSLQVLPRTTSEPDNLGGEGNKPNSLADWARRMGANVFVQGTFALLSDGIHVSLSALTSTDPPRLIAQADGMVPLTDAIAALSPQPIPSQKNEIPEAGVGGVAVPKCAYCPAPRPGKVEALVVLQVTVTVDGRVTNISVIRSGGADLDKKAIEAVRKWRLKPATGRHGQPVAVIVPIEIHFTLYK